MFGFLQQIQPNDHPQSPQQLQQPQQQQQANRNNGKAAPMPRDKQIEDPREASRPALPHRLIVVPDPSNVSAYTTSRITFIIL